MQIFTILLPTIIFQIINSFSKKERKTFIAAFLVLAISIGLFAINFIKNSTEIVAVAGGANAACQGAVQLSHVASKVYIIYRGAELRCDPIWMAQIKNDPKIEVLYNTAITEIVGDSQRLTGVKIKPVSQDGEIKELNLERLFIEIGGVPGTSLVIPLGVEMDPGGYVKVNEKLETNVPGIFAAGDVVSHKFSIEQISSAVGSGARASTSAFSYLKQQNAPSIWGSSQIQRPTPSQQ